MGYYNDLSLAPRTTDDDYYDRMDYGMKAITPRARTGIDIFADYTPVAPARKRKCVVCPGWTPAGDLCENCRRDLHGLLVRLTHEQDTIIARMVQDTVDLGLAISCASQDEVARYATLCKARSTAEMQHDLGSNRALEDFNRRYLATHALQTPLGAIVRADSKVHAHRSLEGVLADLQRQIDAVDCAIEGLKESEVLT